MASRLSIRGVGMTRPGSLGRGRRCWNTNVRTLLASFASGWALKRSVQILASQHAAVARPLIDAHSMCGGRGAVWRQAGIEQELVSPDRNVPPNCANPNQCQQILRSHPTTPSTHCALDQTVRLPRRKGQRASPRLGWLSFGCLPSSASVRPKGGQRDDAQSSALLRAVS